MSRLFVPSRLEDRCLVLVETFALSKDYVPPCRTNIFRGSVAFLT